MKHSRLLHVTLAIVGIGALTAYLVACRPAWSPDGSKVLFPYANPATKQVGIALFDKSSGKTTSLFLLQFPASERSGPSDSFPWTQWTADGQRAVVIWAREAEGRHQLHLRLLPVDSEKPAREFVLPDVEAMPGLPLAELEGCLFVGGKALVRVDLASGMIERRQLDGNQEVILVGHKKQIHYLVGGGSDDAQAYEIGTLDPKQLALRPALKLKAADVGGLSPYFAVAGDGSTLAVSSVKDARCQLLIIAGDGLKKTIPLNLSSETHVVGNLQWSPDANTVYAALIAQVQGQEAIQLGLLEVTVETGATRATPLVRIGKAIEREGLPMVFQIGLAPDGKTIATAPTYLGQELQDKKDMALHLVDLTSPERKVTQIPVPVPGAPNE